MPLSSGDRHVINDPSGKASAARFTETIRPRLSVPLVAAPMFRVSGPELVIAACKAGVIGSFPTANCRTNDELDSWIARILGALGPDDAPFCPNLIIRRESLQDDLATVIRHGCEMVITSVGPPDAVVAPLHEAGCMVFADVASIRHAKKAIAAGVRRSRLADRWCRRANRLGQWLFLRARGSLLL